MQRIIFKNIDGSIGIIIPAPEALMTMTIDDIALKDVPKGLQYWIVDTAIIPTDRTYRDAWVFDDITGAIFVDPIKSAPILSNTKWQQVDEARKILTITTTSGHVYSASQDGISSISKKEASMTSTDTCKWYEDWGSFITNKVELQEALALANIADQAILDSIIGV